MKKIFNKYKKYAIAPLITIAIVLCVYLVKGIYPFGNITIANGDMGQSYMTFYYFLYDVCHGTKSLFFDYTLGMGSNMYGGFMMDGLLNPTSYIILLNSRENIPYMFSFVILFKFAFIALTSYILFKKINKKKEYYNYLFSVLYALSAYSLMYNTNLMWLDIVGLFPLFILATKHMFEKNKVTWFAVVLALILIFNYNLAYMVLMFIIFILPIYIHYALEKEKRKKAVFNLIVGILLSIGLSAFAFIPSFLQVITSYRMSGAVENTVSNINFGYKMATFLFYSLPIFFYVKWACFKEKDKTHFKIYTLGLIFCAVIPILFERVNLWWHTGSYQMFPFRYGFIPLLILYMGALRYINLFKKDDENNKIKKSNLAIIVLVIVVLSLISLYTAVYINKNFPAFVLNNNAFIFITIVFLISFLIINFIFKLKNTKLENILLSIVTLTSVFAYSYAYIGVVPEYRGGAEWSDEGVFYGNKINEKIDSELYRLKDLTGNSLENTPIVSNVPSMSTFLHIISEEQVLNAVQLGYRTNGTKLNDFGGTLFTDALYGVKYVISPTEMSDELYTYLDRVDGNYLYEYNYTLPFGIMYDEEILNIPDEYYAFEANNYLYQKLFDKTDDIIDVKKVNVKEEDNKLKYDINVEGKKELYLYIKEGLMINVKINGNDVVVPTNNYKDNKLIVPTNGIIDLGYFENEKNSIEIEVISNFGDEKNHTLEIGLLDIDKYFEISDVNHNVEVNIDKNEIIIDGNVNKNTNIMLPIVYDDGFESDSEIKQVFNTFIGIPLEKGENHIVLTFFPKTFKLCFYITISTVILIILFNLCKFKIKIFDNKIIVNIFWIIGIVIYCLFITKFYIISIFETILSFFK